MTTIVEYLFFRRLIAVPLVQGIFWSVSVGWILIQVFLSMMAFLVVLASTKEPEGHFLRSFFITAGITYIVVSMVSMVIVPVLVRLTCEIVIVLFRINNTLTEINSRE